MSKLIELGLGDSIEIGDLDRYGDTIITVKEDCKEVDVYVEKNQALAIIEKLKEVFEL